MCLILAGCTTTRTATKTGYITGDVRETQLKGLTDSEALELFEGVYSEPVEDRTDTVAKNLTITAFMRAFKSMNSKEIKKSGVMNRKYEKVDLDKWTDNELVLMYDDLDTRIKGKDKEGSYRDDIHNSAYWGVSAGPSEEEKEGSITIEKDSSIPEMKGPEEVDKETSLEVIRLTALYSVANELNRRNEIAGRWSAAKAAAGVGATLAMRVALILAGFFL